MSFIEITTRVSNMSLFFFFSLRTSETELSLLLASSMKVHFLLHLVLVGWKRTRSADVLGYDFVFG